MRRCACLFAITLSLAAENLTAESLAAESLPAPPVTITSATGVYQPCRIALVKAGPDNQTIAICGGFRDGEVAIAGPLSVQQHVGQLSLSEHRIRGHIDGPPSITIIAEVAADGQVNGSWQRGVAANRRTGDVRGWIRSGEEMAVTNAIDRDLNWPSWAGPTFNKIAPVGPAPLVEQLDQARVVWRSEFGINRGQGNLSPYWRMGDYIQRAFTGPTGGGGASPVVYAGNVYAFTIQPSHDGPHHHEAMNVMADAGAAQMAAQANPGSDIDSGTGDAGLDALLDDFASETGGQTDREAALAAVSPYAREKYALECDEIVVCLDAATGATKWVTTFPRAGINVQDHKRGPCNITPVVAGDRIYATGTSGRVYALDRHSGALLWHNHMPTADNVRSDRGYGGNFNQSPIVVDDLLLVPDHRTTLYAFDTASGEELWRAEHAVGRVATITPWHNGSRTVIVTLMQRTDLADDDETPDSSRLQALDLSTGKPVWQLDGPFDPDGFTLIGDLLVARANNVTTSGTGDLASVDIQCYQLTPHGPELRWTYSAKAPHTPSNYWMPVVGNGFVYLSGRNSNLLLDLETGVEIVRHASPGAANQGLGILAGDRLILRRDGNHGDGPFVMLGGLGEHYQPHRIEPNRSLDFDDERPDAPTYIWRQPFPITSSYHRKPMVFPIVDGRMFVRGTDGIYCIDLRAVRH